MAARKHESERTVPGYVSPKESPKAQRKKANTRDANDRKNALVAKLRSSVPGSPLLVRKPTGIPPFIALTNQRLPTIIDALQTPPLARPQSYVDSFAMTMTVIPQTMTTSTEAASRALAAGAITVADAVKNSLPFDVELFKDLANMLMTVLTRNAHEMPPLDIGELLLCLGMYCHYQIQKRLDEEDTVELQEILRETPRVTDREPYERFLYCIDFAEAAYYPNVEGILKICRQLQSSWIIDAKHESDEDCPAFFLATDHQNWTIVIAIRGTASLHDAIVDLKMDCEPFLHGYAHQGMAHLARKLLDRILPHMHLLRLKHPNYRTIVTGHSLGAGIASLLTLLLTSPPYATYFHDVRGVCYATPACCTEELTDRAAKVVDSLVLGYDVVPALSEKTLIWLLRELQRFSKENQHRKLLSETWNKQMEAMYENLSSNPRTGFLISAWESEAMSTVRNSIGTAANVAAGALVAVSDTAQETAAQVVIRAGETVQTLQQAGFVPPEPTVLSRYRRRLCRWVSDFYDDVGETSTMLTIALTYTSRVILRRYSWRFSAASATTAVLGQVMYLRWKRHTEQKLERDLDQSSSDKEHVDISSGHVAVATASGSAGDGSTTSDRGEMKVLLTPATLFYLREWRERKRSTSKIVEIGSDVDEDEDPCTRDVQSSGSDGEKSPTSPDPNTSPVSQVEPTPIEPIEASRRHHILLQSGPMRFTEIVMNSRMIDDHLLSSYRRALESVLWDDEHLA